MHKGDYESFLVHLCEVLEIGLELGAIGIEIILRHLRCRQLRKELCIVVGLENAFQQDLNIAVSFAE